MNEGVNRLVKSEKLAGLRRVFEIQYKIAFLVDAMQSFILLTKSSVQNS